MTAHTKPQPPWRIVDWLKMLALLLAVGAAMVGAVTWGWSQMEAPEVMARSQADAQLEVRVAGLSDSVRKVYTTLDNRVDQLDSKLDRVLDKLDHGRR